jgi:hypothetical protein
MKRNDKIQVRNMTPAELEFLQGAREGDNQRVNDALVEQQRDPSRWFCSGVDEAGVPCVFGRGDTEATARENARTGAARYVTGKGGFRIMAPISEWQFITYPPTPWPSGQGG